MQENAVSRATSHVAAATLQVADAVDALRPREPEPLGARRSLASPFRGLPGLGLALKLCRYADEDGVWHGLAEHVKRVPSEHLIEAGASCVIATREVLARSWLVLCPCGARAIVRGYLADCPGACRRLFFADDSGVFAVRMPEPEAFDEATRSWVGEAS